MQIPWGWVRHTADDILIIINTGEMELTAENPGNVSEIKAPLLVAQGANDPRVRKSESDQIVQALRHRGVDDE